MKKRIEGCPKSCAYRRRIMISKLYLKNSMTYQILSHIKKGDRTNEN